MRPLLISKELKFGKLYIPNEVHLREKQQMQMTTAFKHEWVP